MHYFAASVSDTPRLNTTLDPFSALVIAFPRILRRDWPGLPTKTGQPPAGIVHLLLRNLSSTAPMPRWTPPFLVGLQRSSLSVKTVSFTAVSQHHLVLASPPRSILLFYHPLHAILQGVSGVTHALYVMVLYCLICSTERLRIGAGDRRERVGRMSGSETAKAEHT